MQKRYSFGTPMIFHLIELILVHLIQLHPGKHGHAVLPLVLDFEWYDRARQSMQCERSFHTSRASAQQIVHHAGFESLLHETVGLDEVNAGLRAKRGNVHTLVQGSNVIQ
jgi:hypothetical protein